MGKNGVHAQQGQVGPVVQDADVDRVEHGHGEDAGQQVRHLEPVVDGRGDESGQHPACKSQQQPRHGVHSTGQRCGHDNGTHGKTAVHGKIRKIEDSEGEKHPQCHDGVYQPFDEDAFKHDEFVCFLAVWVAAVRA